MKTVLRCSLALLLTLGSVARAITIDEGGIQPFSNKFVTGNQSVLVKSGPGILHAIIISNDATGGAITVYDGTAATGGTLLGGAVAGTPSGGLLSGSGNPPTATVGPLDIAFTNGLFVVTSGSTNNQFMVIFL
jgi:hypothetical protein